MARQSAHIALLALAGLILFSANIGGYDLWPADEPRYGLVAREMLQTGDLWVLRVNEEPYFEKPPLFFWSIAAISAPFGDVNAWTARAPSVLAGVATLILTYLLGARLYSPTVGLWAGAALMTMNRFWWQARTAQTDMLLTAFMLLALYAFWRWSEEQRGGWLGLVYAAIAAGLLTKGPPALVFPLLTIFAFYWRQGAERKQTHWVVGSLAAIAVLAAWYIPAFAMAASESARQGLDPGDNVFRQTIGRAVLGVSKPQWPGYYIFETIPVDLLPWTLVAPWTVYWTWRNRRSGKPMRLLLSWLLPALVFFSIIIGKRAIYLLPLFPVMAILIGASLPELLGEARTLWRRRTAWAWVLVLALLGAAPFVILFIPEYQDEWSPAFLMLSIPAWAFAAYSGWRAATTPARRLPHWIAGQFGCLALITVFVAFPALNPHKSARDFCAPLRALAQAGEDFRIYSVAFSREAYVFYSEHPHTEVLTDTLDIATETDLGYWESVQKQVETRRAIARAVEDVPIADINNVTEAELDELEAAVRETVDDEDVAGEFAAAVESALREKIAEFEASFREGKPAYLFVRHEDWRWLLPFHPPLRELPVLHHSAVGHRDVLLVANEAGVELLEARPEARLEPDLTPQDEAR